MGEKVIIASRPVVVTLVICNGGGKGWSRPPVPSPRAPRTTMGMTPSHPPHPKTVLLGRSAPRGGKKTPPR